MHALKRSLLEIRSLPLRFPPQIARHIRSTTQQSLRQGRRDTHDSPFPDPSTAKHYDLASFLAYADRTGLDVSSTVYVGTHYEYTVASALAQYGIQAARVGGISDYGIDILGTWTLPKNKLKIILQCKGGAQKVNPSRIRELEGSFIGAPVGWRGEGVVAFMVSEKTASKGVREGMGRSRWPMGFISCSQDGVIRQMLWNQRAEDEGLRGMNVTLRHPGEGNDEPQVVLTYKGKRVRSISSGESTEM